MAVKKAAKTRSDPLPKELFEILACPSCKKDLGYSKAKTALVCAFCKKEYPIEEGIPILLPR
ncbi:MAG TPA: Trm112 family protein [Candidatus Nanoarchaeia archaeon]|nr:Trm112 family protein [Candidatus Nanoarchaeia archaeon]